MKKGRANTKKNLRLNIHGNLASSVNTRYMYKERFVNLYSNLTSQKESLKNGRAHFILFFFFQKGSFLVENVIKSLQFIL